MGFMETARRWARDTSEMVEAPFRFTVQQIVSFSVWDPSKNVQLLYMIFFFFPKIHTYRRPVQQRNHTCPPCWKKTLVSWTRMTSEIWNFLRVHFMEVALTRPFPPNTHFTLPWSSFQVGAYIYLYVIIWYPLLIIYFIHHHFVSFSLSLSKEVQIKAQAEIDAVIGTDRLPSLCDLPHLPYVRAVVTEVLRWNSVAPTGVPHRAIQDGLIAGYFIPKDAIILCNLWYVNINQSKTMFYFYLKSSHNNKKTGTCYMTKQSGLTPSPFHRTASPHHCLNVTHVTSVSVLEEENVQGCTSPKQRYPWPSQWHSPCLRLRTW